MGINADLKRLTVAFQGEQPSLPAGVSAIGVGSFFSGAAMRILLEMWKTDYLLVFLPGAELKLGERATERLIRIADDTGAGMIYSDFREETGAGISGHPLIDYQPGSIRDNFDFGSLLFFSRACVERALQKHGEIPRDLIYGGLYDLRLKLSLDSTIFRVPEPLYTRFAAEERGSGERLFDYVDARNRDYQIEMERIATGHLKRSGAFLEPDFASVPESQKKFPVKASIVIPVRNRVMTIADAVRSALCQKTDFPFNLIVVDNHSNDGTSYVLQKLAGTDARLVHLIPARTDLGIGGCWNEAIYSEHCGRYAVQLDSDDIYATDRALARIVAEFERGPYAMVIGSYTIVDFDLNELPPGLIDHREWTRENGRNNALRINGLGAPRAFAVNVLREFGLPNVSYGEDYAIALRLSRQYEIGRIYDSIYYARRWAGNSDNALPLATVNRYDFYKDR
ncbi:MAG: glycosyltransferase family 2 protein, partial [Blastocatellia bacterium]|nr:glycosyltransferase family 2 protein [Blastocatellia bacterium]